MEGIKGEDSNHILRCHGWMNNRKRWRGEGMELQLNRVMQLLVDLGMV